MHLEKLKKKIEMLISIALVIEILIIIVGISLYVQGPTPYLMILNATDAKNFMGDREWFYQPIWFPTGKVHAKFALNTTISVLFNYSKSGLIIYLLNETQFVHWEESKSHYILIRSYPNYDFSLQVEPDDYFLAINLTNLEGNNTIQAFTDIKVTFENFNYSRVGPSLCILFVGVLAANVNIMLMRRRRMFNKINSFFRNMFVPRSSFPRKSIYAKYSLETYDTFAKPIASWLIQLLPALTVLLAVFRASPRSTSPFTSVAWDYVALAAITSYFIVLLISSLFFLTFLFVMTTFAELTFLISKKLGVLKAIDVSVISKINTLSLSRIRKRKNVFTISIPLILFAIIVAVAPHTASQGANLPSFLWIAIILLLTYYGLVFSYIKSSALKEFAVPFFDKKTKKHFSSRLRLHSLIDAIVTTLGDFFFFFAFSGIVTFLFFCVFFPVLSSSLAVKYNLATTPNVSLVEVFTLLVQVVWIGLLLVWSIFYGITGYIVPELIDRGLRSSFVGLVAFFLTFLTERVLSAIFDPYLNIDFVLSLLLSFSMFVSVWIFERFYRKMLLRYEH